MLPVQWKVGKLGLEYMEPVCFISYICMWIYNYLKSLIKNHVYLEFHEKCDHVYEGSLYHIYVCICVAVVVLQSLCHVRLLRPCGL